MDTYLNSIHFLEPQRLITLGEICRAKLNRLNLSHKKRIFSRRTHSRLETLSISDVEKSWILALILTVYIFKYTNEYCKIMLLLLFHESSLLILREINCSWQYWYVF